MPARKHVEWDEQNLSANAEYQRQHPVTMHITEPKTPYSHFNDGDLEEDDALQKWDPTVNARVKEFKENVIANMQDRPKAPVSRSGRPMLLSGTASSDVALKQQQREFQQLRKTVYADEGAMFKHAIHCKSDVKS